ncbi:MAG: YdcF family protein [Mariprofundaceae bacterium]
MLLTSKLLSQLLLPPGGLILLAFIGLIFWRHMWGRLLIALALLLFWLLSTEPVRDALTGSLEYQQPVLQLKSINTKLAAIVVLGGGVYEAAPEYDGKDALRHFAMMRILYAAELSKKMALPVFVSGGKPLNPDSTAEAVVMKRWLQRFGVASTQIYEESSANNTWQNAVYLKNILAEQGIKHVFLVTSAWHMPRALGCFKAQGIDATAAPTDYLTSSGRYDMRSYMPRWNVLSDSTQALHEYMGLIWYHWRYGS